MFLILSDICLTILLYLLIEYVFTKFTTYHMIFLNTWEAMEAIESDSRPFGSKEFFFVLFNICITINNKLFCI